ncbi:MAG: 4Fe-4S binding protein [Candidatus Heimdallarchaeota archaeon]|nr:4Fe-4S binding protein [Candidatus Heimdallarchaeota archaeon]
MAVAGSNPERSVFQDWMTAITRRRIRSIRLITQLIMFVLVNGVIIGLSRVPFPAPISFPAGSPFGTVWGGLDAIQFILTRGQFPFLVFGLFFLTGATVGKLFCGWACPVGLWQDLLAIFPLKKTKISKPDNKAFQDISGFILWFVVGWSAWIGFQRIDRGNLEENFFTSIPYGFIDPAGTLFITLWYAFTWKILPGENSFDAIDSMGTMFLWKMGALLVIMFISMKVPRAYCRWVCPTGALLGYMSKNSILTVKRDPLKCTDGCKACEDACPMGVPITDEDPDGIANSLCINCGNCIDACPEAMSFGFRL